MQTIKATAARKQPAASRVSSDILDFYRQTSDLTSAGSLARLYAPLPADAEGLARIVQGLVLHKYMASAYGIEVPAARDDEAHIRHVEEMLDIILEHDTSPLQVARIPEKRLAGVCGHFTALLVSMLRSKGIPARERAGFGAYFNAPHFEEHVLCEYWNDAENRWVLLDTQFDDIWRAALKPRHDAFDVPRDQFLTASAAWTLCRTGRSDPKLFGIFNGNKRGLWFIAAELVRDVAALNKMEVLVWDVWGTMPKPDSELDDEQIAFFDHLADLTRDPDASFCDLRAIYRNNDRVRVPPTVFNVIRNRPENI
jgi:hypothetical protein